jgi:hypothetical protein
MRKYVCHLKTFKRLTFNQVFQDSEDVTHCLHFVYGLRKLLEDNAVVPAMSSLCCITYIELNIMVGDNFHIRGTCE